MIRHIKIVAPNKYNLGSSANRRKSSANQSQILLFVRFTQRKSFRNSMLARMSAYVGGFRGLFYVFNTRNKYFTAEDSKLDLFGATILQLDAVAHWLSRQLSTGGCWVRLPLKPTRRDLGQVLNSQLPVALRCETPEQQPCCVGSASEQKWT